MTAVLQLRGIPWLGVAGYLLVSRVVFSTETTVLAAGLLAWWPVLEEIRTINFTDLLSMTRGRTVRVKVPATDY